MYVDYFYWICTSGNFLLFYFVCFVDVHCVSNGPIWVPRAQYIIWVPQVAAVGVIECIRPSYLPEMLAPFVPRISMNSQDIRSINATFCECRCIVFCIVFSVRNDIFVYISQRNFGIVLAPLPVYSKAARIVFRCSEFIFYINVL
jgi:hypothetical protein